MTATAASTTRPWIVSARWDLFLFIATPVLCIAVILPWRGVASSFAIFLVVMAFSSFGHHLPGFLRAYGDADLFRRYRLRFLLAPPLVFATFLWFGMQNLHGMAFLLMAWSIWHVLMQHYGFLRIYDAKVGAGSRLGAHLDRAMCVLWFVSIVLWSPEYTHNLLANLYESGVFLIPLEVLEIVRNVVWAATFLVTLLYAAHLIARRRRGRAISGPKLALLVITTAFLYYAWVGLGDLYLGLAVWEVFHDIQYFAITWIYNRRLVDKGFGNTRLMRFLFRGRPLLGLYVLAIVVYGSSNYWIVTQTEALVHTALMAFVFTSTLLHYYYDGFIWKVRQRRTQEGLDLRSREAATEAAAGPASTRPAFWGAALHVGLFLLPIGTLAAFETLGKDNEPVAMREAIEAAAPAAPLSQVNLALAYSNAGRMDESLRHYEQALLLAPEDPQALGGYGVALLMAHGSDQVEKAAIALHQAFELEPDNARHAVNLATLYLQEGRRVEAIDLYMRAHSIDPKIEHATADTTLLAGLALMAINDLHAAIPRFESVLERRPDDAEALEALRIAAEYVGDERRARHARERLLELEPNREDLRPAPEASAEPAPQGR